MPGMLLPSDLDRMVPPGADPFRWAETNLLASPGALMVRPVFATDSNIGYETFYLHPLVPATKQDGSCIHYQQRKCAIWENSPFGCAFFGCGCKDHPYLTNAGFAAVMATHDDPQSLYSRIWHHLWDLGKRQDPPEEIKARMEGVSVDEVMARSLPPDLRSALELGTAIEIPCGDEFSEVEQ